MTPVEKRQRTHELYEAYKAARLLEQRLELCVDYPALARDDRTRATNILQDLAAELIALGQPMPDFGA